MSENKKANRLYPINDALQVLGSLCKDTSLILNKEYNLEVDDFVNPIHKVVYASINNLIRQGVKDIDDNVISNYMSTNQPSWYSIYNPTDTQMDFIENIKKLANVNNFIYHHARLRKFSFLRDISSKGYNIGLLYDISEQDRELNNKFENTNLNDIVQNFSLAQLEIKDSWIINSDDREYFRPDNYLNQLLLDLKKTPAFGYPFGDNLEVLTQITRGLRAGKFYIQSGGTGSGK